MYPLDFGRHRLTTILAATALLLTWLPVAGQQAAAPISGNEGPSVKNLWTGHKEVRPARFHALWVFTGFNQAVLEKNRRFLQAALSSFQQDFDELQEKKGRVTPIGTVVAPPSTNSVIVAPTMTLADVNNTLDRLSRNDSEDQLQEGDVAFIYIMAHGRADLGQEEVYLDFGGTQVRRADIVARLKAIQTQRRARLLVFITDHCSVVTIDGKASSPLSTDRSTSIWRALYFGHNGFVDLSSTTFRPAMDGKKQVAQAGFLVNDVSVFLQAFSSSFDIYGLPQTSNLPKDEAKSLFADSLDKRSPGNGPRDGLVDWTEFADHLNGQMNAAFARNKELLRGKNNATWQQMEDQGSQDILFAEYGELAVPRLPGD